MGRTAGTKDEVRTGANNKVGTSIRARVKVKIESQNGAKKRPEPSPEPEARSEPGPTTEKTESEIGSITQPEPPEPKTESGSKPPEPEITEIGSHNKIGTAGTRKRARAKLAGTESHIKVGTTGTERGVGTKMTGTESQSKVGTTGTSERAGPDPDIERARSPTVQGTHAQQNEKFTTPEREPDARTRLRHPGINTTPEGKSYTQTGSTHAETSTPTVQGAPALQNERFTQPQREDPVPRPESGTQRVTPPTPHEAH